MTDPRTIQINIRVSPVEAGRIERVARERGHRSSPEYIRVLALKDAARLERKQRKQEGEAK